MAATLLSIFGLLALALAALGLYRVMAYAVSQRTRELGIRISVGASRGDVLKLILGQAVTLAAIGMTGGLVTALGHPLCRESAVWNRMGHALSPCRELSAIDHQLMRTCVSRRDGETPVANDPSLGVRKHARPTVEDAIDDLGRCLSRSAKTARATGCRG